MGAVLGRHAGNELEVGLVEAARAEEIATVKRRKVWVKMDGGQSSHETGSFPIKFCRDDVKKGDDDKPNCRNSMAKDINTDPRPDLFAATPLVEHIEHLISRVASRQRDLRPTLLMVQDVKNEISVRFQNGVRLLSCHPMITSLGKLVY